MQLIDGTRIKFIVSKPIYLIVALGILASVSACSHEDWRKAAHSPARQADLLDLTAWEFERKLKPYDPSAKCSAIGGDMISCGGYFTKWTTAHHLFDKYRTQSGRPWLRLNFQEGHPLTSQGGRKEGRPLVNQLISQYQVYVNTARAFATCITGLAKPHGVD